MVRWRDRKDSKNRQDNRLQWDEEIEKTVETDRTTGCSGMKI
jgi:hypothetical protein